MTARDSVILPINYIIWRKSGPVLTGPTGPAPTPLFVCEDTARGTSGLIRPCYPIMCNIIIR